MFLQMADFFFLLKIYLFIYDRPRETERERERMAETQAEGEAGSMQGARRGTRSGASRITPGLKAALNRCAPELPPLHLFKGLGSLWQSGSKTAG